MTIKNEAKIKEDHVLDMRRAMGHRAAWLYFLLDEARQAGLDWDGFARKAITRVGHYHGGNLFKITNDLVEFAQNFPGELNKKILEIEVQESTPERYVLDFNYCPLVAEWQKHTDNEEEIAHLCDIAMDGDRGICSKLPSFELEIQSKIADGDDVCRLVFTADK